MKGHTDIPFARKTAELIKYPEKYSPDFNNKDITFWARVVHFEYRYWSIDNLLSDLRAKNILELSSGFSFRGLEAVKRKGVYYIDTDLPGVIDTKKEFIKSLAGESFKPEGKLELLPLNVLDENQFHDIVSRFPGGEIAIVNEGLLMYLDIKEKEKLCGIIHEVLAKRGGCWITADVYIKSGGGIGFETGGKTREFYGRHRIEDNKFENFEEAESFFRRAGFKIDKEADPGTRGLSSMQYLIKNAGIKQLSKLRSPGKTQATWRLRSFQGTGEPW
jgi:O-methyltransferase involved in polyketide biosynthesis